MRTKPLQTMQRMGTKVNDVHNAMRRGCLMKTHHVNTQSNHAMWTHQKRFDAHDVKARDYTMQRNIE